MTLTPEQLNIVIRLAEAHRFARNRTPETPISAKALLDFHADPYRRALLDYVGSLPRAAQEDLGVIASIGRGEFDASTPWQELTSTFKYVPDVGEHYAKKTPFVRYVRDGLCRMGIKDLVRLVEKMPLYDAVGSTEVTEGEE